MPYDMFFIADNQESQALKMLKFLFISDEICRELALSFIMNLMTC